MYILNEDYKTYYTASTEDYTAAPDVYVEIVTGGYHIYILENTTKTYLNATQSNGHYNLIRSTTASNVWSWDSEKSTFVTTAGDSQVTLGTYGSNISFSVSTIDKFGATSYSAYLAVMVDGETGGEGGSETPAEPEPVEGLVLSFADVANRTSISEDAQVWEQNGVKLTNGKTATSSAIVDYSNPARFYKNSSLTIECTGMKKIVFNCDDYKTTYPTDLQASITDANATVTVVGTVVTVEFAKPVDSFTIAALAGQVRVDSLTVVQA